MNLAKYIGKPFEDGGRGPDAYDCWGLLKALYRDVLGIELPLEYNVSAYATLAVGRSFHSQISSGLWTPVETPARPCAVAIANHGEHPNLVNHCGFHLGNGLIMHCLKPTGVIVQRADDPRIKGRIKGYYEWTPSN